MSRNANIKNTQVPVEQHIIAEGKVPSSKMKFDLDRSGSKKELRPIFMKWTLDNKFTYILS